MADNDFTFESEEILKKRGIRKYIIVAAALVVIGVAAAIIITMTVTKNRNTYTEGAESGYPYIWQVKKDGSLTLTIDKSASPDYSWVSEGSGEYITVGPARKQKNGSSSFTLLASEPCIEQLTFRLQKNDDEADRIREYTFNVMASRDGESGPVSLEVMDGVITALQGMIIGEVDEDGRPEYVISRAESTVNDTGAGEETTEERITGRGEVAMHIPDRYPVTMQIGDMNAYYLDPQPKGFVNRITGETYEDWRTALSSYEAEGNSLDIESYLNIEKYTYYEVHKDWTAYSNDRDIVEVTGVILSSAEEIETDEDAGVTVYLSGGGTPGVTEVVVRSESAGKEIVLTVELSESGGLVVTNSTTNTFEPNIVEFEAYMVEEGAESYSEEEEETVEEAESEEATEISGEGLEDEGSISDDYGESDGDSEAAPEADTDSAPETDTETDNDVEISMEEEN